MFDFMYYKPIVAAQAVACILYSYITFCCKILYVHTYEGCSINKLQNSVILLVF